MTPELLRERIAKLKNEREELVHQLIAYDGAIQDCEYWLAFAEHPEGQEESDDPAPLLGDSPRT